MKSLSLEVSGGCGAPATFPLVLLAFEYLTLTQLYPFFWGGGVENSTPDSEGCQNGTPIGYTCRGAVLEPFFLSVHFKVYLYPVPVI